MTNKLKLIQNAQIEVARMTYINRLASDLIRTFGGAIEVYNDTLFTEKGVSKDLRLTCHNTTIALEIMVKFDEENEPYFIINHHFISEERLYPKAFYEPYQLEYYLYSIAKGLFELDMKD